MTYEGDNKDRSHWKNEWTLEDFLRNLNSVGEH